MADAIELERNICDCIGLYVNMSYIYIYFKNVCLVVYMCWQCFPVWMHCFFVLFSKLTCNVKRALINMVLNYSDVFMRDGLFVGQTHVTDNVRMSSPECEHLQGSCGSGPFSECHRRMYI